MNRRILLYGNSVILGSIAASLRQCSRFDVTTRSTSLPDSKVHDTVTPDIVLFDLDSLATEPVFDLLKTNPALLLIGISPGVNLVRVWNSQQLREISMQELLEMIKNLKNSTSTKEDA